MYRLQKAFFQFLLYVKNIKNKKALDKHKKQLEKLVGNIDADTKAKLLKKKSFDNIKITTDTDTKKQEVEVLATKIVKKYFNDTDKTIKILEKKGVKVYRSRKILNVLKKIKEKPGMVLPLSGFNAFYLNFMLGLICEKKLVFKKKTDLMFVFTEDRVDTFYLASQVYLFVAYKKHLPGFEPDIQNKYKQMYRRPTSKKFKALKAGEIFALKEAIARDVEAIDFATKLHDEEAVINKLNEIKSKKTK